MSASDLHVPVYAYVYIKYIPDKIFLVKNLMLNIVVMVEEEADPELEQQSLTQSTVSVSTNAARTPVDCTG